MIDEFSSISDEEKKRAITKFIVAVSQSKTKKELYDKCKEFSNIFYSLMLSHAKLKNCEV